MKQNHFFIPYCGNKRQEVENIYNAIKDHLDKIDIIVEPFCGSSALSYYISTLHPKRFKYILNDNNNILIELYNISKDENKYNNLVNNLILLKEQTTNKEDYLKIVKKADNDLLSYIFINKIYAIRPGLYPTKKYDTFKGFDKLKDCPMLNFVRNENIVFRNEDAIKVYDEFKGNKKALIFIDPPYLSSENSWYKSPSITIYEYLFDNDIKKEKALIVLCLENIWMIKLLFKNKKCITYEKKYETTKKKTEHIIILNK
jgi:site-specific DNA-adenine methylase